MKRPARHQFRKPFAFASFNQSAIASAVPAAATKLFAQAASFSAKSGKQAYGLDTFWHGCAAKAEPGLEVSLLSIRARRKKQACALSAEQTPPQPTTKQEKTATRMDFYRQPRTRTVAYFPTSGTHGVFAGASAKRKFGAGGCALGYHVVRKLRGAAQLLYRSTGAQKKRGRKRQYDGKVKFTDLRRFEQFATATPHLTLYALVVWAVSLQRPRRVVVGRKRKAKTKPRSVVLCSPDTELSATASLRFYKARFQIEFSFRAAKQCAGFSAGPRQRPKGAAFSLQRRSHGDERGRASWPKQNSKQRRSLSSPWRAASNARSMNTYSTC